MTRDMFCQPIVASLFQKGYVKLNRGLMTQSCVGNTDENDLGRCLMEFEVLLQ